MVYYSITFLKKSMGRLYIANWKSNKTAADAIVYLNTLKEKLTDEVAREKQIIICPVYTSLPACASFVRDHMMPIALGAQDISPFEPGAYTGEVAGAHIKEFATHVIIGHSERENYLHEDQDLVIKKIQQAKAAGLMSILCLRDPEHFVEGADIVVYEPPSAISTNPHSAPEDPSVVASALDALSKKTNVPLLYGGSVKPDTVHQYDQIANLSGYLIGGASLEVDTFLSLLT